MSYNSSMGTAATAAPADESLVAYTHVIYALHSLSGLIGILSAATIVGSFVFGLPSIIAVIMNYARRSATHGTFLESHFRWQIRTFWFALLWLVLVWAVTLPLFVILVGIPLLWLGVVAIGIWIIYRVVRGWMALSDRRPMYV